MDILRGATARTGNEEQEKAPNPHLLPGAIIVPIELIHRDPNQPRRDWRANEGYQRLDELTKSVQEFGILQPLVVREDGDYYVVIAGGRRLVAAQRAGMREIPVIVRNDDNMTRVRIIQLVENLQRHDLAATDEARAFQELIDLEGMTPPQIALRVRVSEQYVRDRLRILRDQVLADAVERRQIAVSVAREINKLTDTAANFLRKRVEAGERIRMSDIAEMRRQLAAAGIVNPRRSRRADRSEQEKAAQSSDAAASDGAPLVETAAEPSFAPPLTPEMLPSWLKPASDRSGRTVRSALQKIERDYQRYRSSAATAPDGSSNHDSLGSDALATSQLVDELLVGLNRELLERLLFVALERGWTVAGLLQNIRATQA